MRLIIPVDGLRLVGIGPDGRPAGTLLVAMPAGMPWPDGDVGRLLAVTEAGDADAKTLDKASAAGANGLLLPVTDGWSQIERIAARLTVAEAAAGLPDRTLAIAAVCVTPRAVLALTGPPPAGSARRLIAIGLQAGLDRAAAASAARGIVQLAAADLGIPAFEHHAAPTVADLADSRAAGFTAALVPIGR